MGPEPNMVQGGLLTLTLTRKYLNSLSLPLIQI